MKTRVVKISTGYVPQVWMLSAIAISYCWFSVRPDGTLEPNHAKAIEFCAHRKKEQAEEVLKSYLVDKEVREKDYTILSSN